MNAQPINHPGCMDCDAHIALARREMGEVRWAWLNREWDNGETGRNSAADAAMIIRSLLLAMKDDASAPAHAELVNYAMARAEWFLANLEKNK